MLKKLKGVNFLNLLTVIFFLALPYYLFEGKLYVGGDDTRLLYVYPLEFAKNVAFFSWANVSSIGMNIPNQFSIPFLSVWTVFGMFLSEIQLDYLTFSLPLILGFLYFQKFVKELFQLNEDNSMEIYIGSLFFILSPIIVINQLFIFLTTIWLLGVIPAVGYYYLQYLRKPNFIYLYKSMWISFILASALLSVPWLLGFILPVLIAVLLFSFSENLRNILLLIKRTLKFFLFIAFSHAFWLLGFLITYISVDKSSAAAKFASQDFLSTFAATVQGTAIGNIFYPVLNLFHRNIAYSYGWKLTEDFINLYDKTFPLNAVFVVVVLFGILLFRKYFSLNQQKVYLIMLIAFILSLYFFTVNIGPLKDLFLTFGNIPGFVMFRNFYDKFAPGYVFIYAIIFTVGLVLIRKKLNNNMKYLTIPILFLIFLNFSTVKSTVNSPLWTTTDIGKNINFPQEYLLFQKQIEEKISSTNTILSVPFGITSYTAVREDGSSNTYVGVSLVKILSGVNDMSGDMSFSLTGGGGEGINSLIIQRDYDKIIKILHKHNINYVLVTKNIPEQVLNSYVFNIQSVNKQDKQFIDAITDKKILTSSKRNYELYSVKNPNTLISSRNLTYQRINQVKYSLYVSSLSGKQDINFNDTFHAGWKLYLNKESNFNNCTVIVSRQSTKECKPSYSLFKIDELAFVWKKSIFDNTHKPSESMNLWQIDKDFIKKNYSKDYYRENKDGSIDVDFVLYFQPQLAFYYGSIISFITILVFTIYLLKKSKHEKK